MTCSPILMSSWRTMLTTLVAALALAAAPAALTAQFAGDYQASGGLGLSFAPDRDDGNGVGGTLLLERALLSGVWGGARAYAGGFLSKADPDTCSAGVRPCSVSTQIAVAGAKMRLLVPIPYVGPFFEVGVGLSLGSLESRIGSLGSYAEVDESHSGVMFHIPFGLGLAFGSRHQHDLSLDYFAHPGREHIAGSLSLGIGFAWR